ncbi:putative bifunctional diguanylate cyclase/phosphodiesterase [Coralliovum pocilloporae]|uniref:putative bifunctional diguanylate cyclase/phosphodiesterase n=1 Tax=Coralliovum pocilloporae TaxID=3066369 RepID=UPI0033078637
MRQSGRIVFLGVILTGVVIAVLTVGMPDASRQHRVLQQLRMLHEYQANLTRDILLVDNGELLHYDTLVKTLRAMQEVSGDIKRELDEASTARRDDLALIEDYGFKLVELRDQIETYKSENAVLRNSRNYLFGILDRLAELEHEVSEDLEPLLHALEAKILHVLIDGSLGLADTHVHNEGLMSESAMISSSYDRLPTALQRIVKSFQRHAFLIRNRAEKNRALVRHILSGEHLQLSEQIAERINAWRLKADQDQSVYNYSLIAAIVIGAGMILYLFTLMSRLTDRLEVYNSTLELRVRQRTGALEEANANLEREVEERRIAERTIQKLAWRDSLTGLSNRSYLNQELEKLLHSEEYKRCDICLLLLDLDGFKAVNDQFGHPVGDRLLSSIAQRIVETCQPDDTVARLGGDEFAIILKNLSDPEIAMILADRLRDIVHQPVDIDGLSIQVGVSIGAVLAPLDATEAHDLMRKGDLALYHAKSRGRNQVSRFEPRFDVEQRNRRKLEADLRRALETEDGVYLAYQPKVNLQTGTISGLEALFRWDHPVLGTIRPDHAISIAEESGLIIELGLWVMEEAARKMRQWSQAGHDLGRMWVNVSARQLRQDTFVNHVQLILAETGLSPAKLGFEITESLEIESEPFLLARLEQIDTAGIALAIDDFGTGYSSLSYMRQLPVSSVKIDRSFINDMLSCTEDMAITSAAVRLGHALCLPVVAEGVETLDQCQSLHEIGCDELQGYFFTMPLPAHQIEPWFNRFQRDIADTVSGPFIDWDRLEQLILSCRNSSLSAPVLGDRKSG